MSPSIDLNADLGEWTHEGGALRDEALMPWLSSCNIACGGHAGDPATMERTVSLALKHGVAIGAHPSYPDRAGFGRHAMDLPDEDLRRSLDTQLRDLLTIVRRLGGSLHHVKPHGALYHQADQDERTASLLLDVIAGLPPDAAPPRLYGPPGGVMERLAGSAGIPFSREAFADRAYEEHDGRLRLRSRQLPGAVIDDPDAMIRQIGRMIFHGEVETHSGHVLPINAHTICVHSDTPGAEHLARRIHEFLAAAHVEIRSI
jgi:UPF0271 protein